MKHHVLIFYQKQIFTDFLVTIPKIPSKEKYVPTRRLFPQLYMLKLMYPNKEKWDEEFVKPLARLVKKYKADISLKHLDFPYRWKSILKQ